ncbi:MAG: hypothetical protein ABIF17_04700 [Patescibacteria group bacterium]
MKISNKKLDGITVETLSQKRLGKVESFNIDIDSQSILEYKIKPSSVVAGLIKGDLMISRGQVIEILDKKMIVDDLSITSGVAVEKNKTKSKQKIAQGAVMKNLE